MWKMAVIGKDVSKSSSPKMHTFIMHKLGEECTYDTVSLTAEEFQRRAEGLFSEYDAFNVTIPYKLSILPYLSSVNGDAKTFGAVNTVRSSDRSGYNTDGLGFMLMLRNNQIETQGKSALVLGTGGAGRSVVKKLLDGGASVSVFDLRKESALAVQAEFGKVRVLDELQPERYDMIVNVTGVGMHKTEGISPVGADVLQECDIAVDLIYVPEKSEFLRIAESLGKKIVNGKAMLFYQAYYADCIYLGREADEAFAKRIFEEYCTQV